MLTANNNEDHRYQKDENYNRHQDCLHTYINIYYDR